MNMTIDLTIITINFNSIKRKISFELDTEEDIDVASISLWFFE